MPSQSSNEFTARRLAAHAPLLAGERLAVR
jgi:hypothetical protein